MFTIGDVATNDPYRQWIATVKAIGGTVVGNPLDGTVAIPRGAPMVRYPRDVALAIISTGGAPNGLLATSPDIVSHSGNFWYYAAPVAVQDYFFAYDMGIAPSNEAVQKGTDELEPAWYKQLSKTAQVLSVIALAGGGFYLASWLPKRRR